MIWNHEEGSRWWEATSGQWAIERHQGDRQEMYVIFHKLGGGWMPLRVGRDGRRAERQSYRATLEAAQNFVERMASTQKSC